VDDLAYADPKDKSQIGIEIHSGRNRIVRRIFEQLGYDVRGLDRVMYAGLTKKNVQRGHWRLLADKEVRILKYLNSSFKGSPGRAKDMAAPATAASHAPAAPSKPATPAPKPATAPKTATPKPATPKPTPKPHKSHKPFKPHAPKPPK
jgi:cell division septation protein DedD